MSKDKPKMIWYHIARNFCKVFCQLLFRIRYYGLENIPADKAVLFISNHQSYLDPLFCAAYLKRHFYFLARHTLFTNRSFGWLLSSINVMPVRRGEADLATMRNIIEKLKDGNSVCLFPEATRTDDGRIREFKPGFGLLSRRGQAPIIPVLIDGSYECWPRHKKLFSPRAKITVIYGERIALKEIKKTSDKELAKNLTEKLRQMQRLCRLKEGKEPYNY